MQFYAVLNGIVFLIALSDGSLLMCRSTTDICILILYSAMSLNSFISSNSLWSFLYMICHLQIETVLLLPFQFGCLLFIYFSCLIILARTSRLWLIKVVRVAILVSFLILKERLSACHLWVWFYLWACHTWPLLSCGTFPLYTVCWEF